MAEEVAELAEAGILPRLEDCVGNEQSAENITFQESQPNARLLDAPLLCASDNPRIQVC